MAELNRVADSFPNEDCSSIQDIAAELGLGQQRARQVIEKLIKARKVQNLTKKDGAKILYAPPMVKSIIEHYNSGAVVKPRRRKGALRSALGRAELVIQVPVFDKEVSQILMNQFGTEEAISKYLRDKLDEVYKPKLSKLKELEAEFEANKRRLLQQL